MQSEDTVFIDEAVTPWTAQDPKNIEVIDKAKNVDSYTLH